MPPSERRLVPAAARALADRRRRAAAAEPPPPPAAARLRALAARVRRLGLAGRFDPETAYVERDEIARALQRPASEAEGAAGARPPPAPAAPPPPVDAVAVRRLSALLSAKSREAGHLRALLARAVRPVRRRRRTLGEGQLLLRLTGDRP
jgi:hypothetical protein